MAELAGGAVRTLLGVINEEMKMLDRVEGDVQFIKEEMESMNSFLQHLGSTVPAGGEHSEQVRTWMKQVRDLAYDCSNSIDLYLQRGNPSVHRERGPLGLGYLWWVPWYLQKLVAKRSAAIQLRELKERARDVGERRLRYGVQVPNKSGDTAPAALAALSPITKATPWPQAAGIVEAEDDDEDDEPVETDAAVRAYIADPLVGKECSEELAEWLGNIPAPTDEGYNDTADKFASIAIAAPTEERETVEHAIAAPTEERALSDSSASVPTKFCFWITFTGLMPGLPAGPFDILVEMMKQLLPHEEGKASPGKKEEEKASPQKEEEGKAPPQKKEQEEKANMEETEKKQRERVEKELNLMKEVEEKIEKIKNNIKECLDKGREWAPSYLVRREPLDILHGVLRTPDYRVWWWWYPYRRDKDFKMTEAAKMIKEHLETADWPHDRGLSQSTYEGILELEELVPKKPADHQTEKEDKPSEEGKDKSGADDKIVSNLIDIMKKINPEEEPIGKQGEGQIIEKQGEAQIIEKKGEAQIIEKIKEASVNIVVNKLQELLVKPKEAEKQENEVVEKVPPTPDEKAKQIKEKIDGVLQKIKMKLLRKAAGMIQEHLRHKKIIVVLEGFHYAYKWKEIKEFFSYLPCAPRSAVVVITRYPQGSEVFCNPAREPIVCSLSACYYKRVLQLTGQRKHKKAVNYSTRILRDILERCEPHGECMKIFVRDMHANPSRDKEELSKLLENLVFQGSLDDNAKKMIKFSYNDLPRDYKTCLLYLAIFPRGEKIGRSRVAQRWVVEGLVSKDDRPSSLHQAKRCFDQLANRWLVCAAEISTEGKIKSCTVHDLVRDFITNRARKQHITDTRLSQHLARYFSVLSNIRLRPSENIIDFLKKPSHASSQLQLLKVLDLEGCQFSRDNQQYLSNVCNMIALLKFLSLRNTHITSLPSEINKLQQLELLDIRQTTKLNFSAIKLLTLLKLKYLLAGNKVCSIPSTNEGASCSLLTVGMPHKTKSMTALRVLSYVQATERRAWELKKLGELWQLKKLGVVIDDSRAQLQYLLQGISDLNECLQSLSIEIKHGSTSPTAPDTDLAAQISEHLKDPPKFLESLSISGFTNYVPLLPLLARRDDILAKVTLEKTSLNQDDMEVLAKLKKLRSLRLRHIKERELLFKKEGREHTPEDNWFETLKYLVVEGGDITKILFEGRAAHNLEKIVWSFGSREIESLSGLKNLPELKEIEFNGDSIPAQVIQEHIPKTVYINRISVP